MFYGLNHCSQIGMQLRISRSPDRTGVFGTGYVVGTVGDPRTFGATLKLSF